jgi:outer membrane protein assembly factor BamA
MLSLLILSVCFGLTQPDRDPPIVSRVTIAGNVSVPSRTLLRNIRTTGGTAIHAELLREDIEALHQMGCFREIEVDVVETGRGCADVIFHVQERPRIADITLCGVPRSMERRIREMLGEENLKLIPARYFDPVRGKRAVLAVERFLRAQQYPLARADLETGETARGVLITVKIRPGPKLKIGSVEIRGNDSLADAELLAQLRQSRPSRFPHLWSTRGIYGPDLLDQDLRRLRDYYRSQGYAAAVVGNPVIRASRPLKSTHNGHPHPANAPCCVMEHPRRRGNAASKTASIIEGPFRRPSASSA